VQNPYGAIHVPLPPLQSVTSVTYTDDAGDSQTLSTSLYRVLNQGFGKAMVVPVYGEIWPTTRDEPQTVTVRFVAGYDTVPEAIQNALLLLVQAAYDQDTTEVDLLRSTAASLLDPFRVGGLG
jgi:hypothetical protein